jgi:hypothetical protein
MATGLLVSLLMLADTGYSTIGLCFVGVILWFTGVSQVRNAVNSTGTGTFNSFGVLWLVYLVFALIPLVGKIGVVFAIIALIRVAAGFFKFGSNGIFCGQADNGTTLIGVMMLSALVALIPGIGSVLYSIFLLPLIMIGCIKAVSACAKGWQQSEHGF